jgi:phosphinothricin acetyltransferase
LLSGNGRCEETAVDISIRDVTESDAEAIAAIYAHHVLHGTATYDIDPPSVEDTLAKIRRVTGARWPFIAAELDGQVAGYAYVTQFRDRAAYRFAAEDSIYVHPERTGRGVGKALLKALVERSAEYGFSTVIAVIGGAEPASIAVHASCGFVEVGRLIAVGFKFDRWLDSVYMQIHLPS